VGPGAASGRAPAVFVGSRMWRYARWAGFGLASYLSVTIGIFCRQTI